MRHIPEAGAVCGNSARTDLCGGRRVTSVPTATHEAIYQALYIQGRGALKRELVSYLRSGRALRTPRARSQAKAWAHVSEEVMISSRPALAGYGAITMANALKKTVTKLPTQLWQSLTWDRGKELSDHARFTIESGIKVYFADPRSPWQRGTNENTNGLLRQYFPKGTDLSRWSEKEIQAVALTFVDADQWDGRPHLSGIAVCQSGGVYTPT